MKELLTALFSSSFLKETAKRLILKSPKYFNIIKLLGVVCMAVTKLPTFISDLGLQLPPAILDIQSNGVFWAALIGTFVASLSAENATQIATETHSLPLTKASLPSVPDPLEEAKAIEEATPPEPAATLESIPAPVDNTEVLQNILAALQALKPPQKKTATKRRTNGTTGNK